MKKLLCIIITIALLLTSVTTAEAKNDNSKDKGHHHNSHEQNYCEEKQKEFKIHESPVITYGRYKLPINPVEKGMGANVSYNKSKAELTVTKGTISIVINFKKKTVFVNGVADNNSGIFKASNSKKMTVLIKYIAKILGVGVDISDDNIIIIVPGLDLPANVTVTAVGTVVVANALNCTNTHLTAAASITAGQAAGGRAELYVGSRLVAIDTFIGATDNSVTFTTSDGSPTNNELQAMIPSGGIVSVKLYDVNGNCAVSTAANPSLTVDYKAPVLGSISSAVYKPHENKLVINTVGAGDCGDRVDVTMLSLIDYTLGRTYQLTAASGTGSSGTVTDSNTLTIKIGSIDKLGLTGFGCSAFYLNIAAGSLLKDPAGNTSPWVSAPQMIPVNAAVVVPGLDAPYGIILAPVGTVEVANTLNGTSLYLNATAKITPGQAAGGRAELYVGSKLVAADTAITATDNSVYFSTSDGTPTKAELQALITSGGVVTVKLYNAYSNVAVSTVGNPTLTVDYIAPTLTGISSAIYNMANNQLTIDATGAGYYGDQVDVTKLTMIDSTLGRYYQLTSNPTTGSIGTVQSSGSLIINLGSLDRTGLAGFGSSSVYLSVAAGSLLKDTAGNTSPGFASSQIIPVTVLNSVQNLDAPTNVTVTMVSYTNLTNVINCNTFYMEAGAKITPGQATGGKAELYVGNRLVATDNNITALDNYVVFTTSDGTPTNAELQAVVPSGGLVTVKLYNASNKSVVSTVGNPTIIVDYIAPTLTSVASAIYDVNNSKLYLTVTGAGAVGDKVDVTRLALYDTATGKTYQLTNGAGNGSNGSVNSSTLLVIIIGSLDKIGLAGFGGSTVNLTVYAGSLLQDAAGNTSNNISSSFYVPVTIVK